MAEFKEGRSIEEVCADMDADRLVEFAKVCEVAERYEDMVAAVSELSRKLAESPMTVEQRNLFSVAFKNVVGAKRASWRVLESYINEHESKSDKDLASKYMGDLEEELRKVCKTLLGLIEVRKKESADGNIFFSKMAGDYHRYMAELELRKPAGDRNQSHAADARSAYAAAYNKATAKEGGLASTNPIRLGLALNYSVFHYEILTDKDEACRLAKQAFDAAIAQLDSLGEEEYKDSTLIMQLIRDNLTLWQNDDAPAAGPEDDGTMVQDVE